MMRATWMSRALIAVLRDQSISARLRLVPRLAGFAVALLVAFSMASGMVLSTRLSTVEHEGRIALRDLRAMRVLLDETHRALPDVALADRSADRFHAIARDTGAGLASAVEMRASDVHFSRWYADARRAASGLAMSDDAETASPASMDVGFRALAAELDGRHTDAERQLADGLSTLSVLYLRLTLTVAGFGAALLLLLLLASRAALRSVDESIDASAAQLDAFARGDYTVPNDTMEEGPHARLLAAQRRLGRLMRGHADVADALASGAFRRATPIRTPNDRLGCALALVASHMEDLAVTAHRIARGDLTATITPRGPEDSLGLAHAAMARRITEVMREIEQTRAMMTDTAHHLRDDAAALTSLTSDDAERLRRTADRLAHTTLQATHNAERASVLEARSEDCAAVVHFGSLSLQQSFDDLQQMLHESADAQGLAREAALLAVRSVTARATAVEQVEDDARTLAERAASTQSSLVRLAARGAHGINQSGVLIDNVEASIQREQAVVRELSVSSREQASELKTIDHAVTLVHRTVAHSATTARQLAVRVEALTAQTRRLDAVVRRFAKRPATPSSSETQADAARGLSIYRTPPHAHLIGAM